MWVIMYQRTDAFNSGPPQRSKYSVLPAWNTGHFLARSIWVKEQVRQEAFF